MLLIMEDSNAKIEDLKYRLERVVGWVNNCDQKAGILLAIEGVILTIICTSNNIQLIHNRLIKPIYEYWNNDIGCFSIVNTLQIILLGVMSFCIVKSMFFLLRGIMGITDPKLFKDAGLTERSLLHFESISKYEKFLDYRKAANNQGVESIINDFQSQIFINSKICTWKFEWHKKAVRLFMLFILCFIGYIVVNIISR